MADRPGALVLVQERLSNIDRRRGVLIAVAVVAVLSALVGWVAGQQIRSPAEIAASKEPPPPSLITVPVEMRELSQRVVVRGTVRASDATDILVTATSGAAAVITRLPKQPGDLIEEGDVMVEVSGRPVIALEGELPVFRNLIPTLEGPDVRQLEEALLRLGHDPGVVDEVYDADTAAAVDALYRDAGYSPPEPPEADQAEVDGLVEQVRLQEQAVADAEAALAEAGLSVPESQRLSLDAAVEDAENALAVTRSGADQANQEAALAVTRATADRDAAIEAAAAASERLAQAEAGAHPDTGAPPTPAELSELRAENAAASQALVDAEATLASATAAVDDVALQQQAAVESAENQLAIAQASRTEGLAPPGSGPLRTALTTAEEQLAEARADLAEARAKIGAWFPVAELVFLGSTPREVQALNVEVGQTPEGAVMTVTGAETVVESGVSAADLNLIELGAEAILEDDGLDLSVPAVVTFVAENPGGPDLSADRYAMRLEPTGDLPDEALNVNLRISIPISSSGGEVLSVPFAALSAGSDGTARVEVERSSGETELVEVAPGLRADGFVEIDPLGGASLAEGDRVVVGQDLELPTSSAAAAESDSVDESEDESEDEEEP